MPTAPVRISRIAVIVCLVSIGIASIGMAKDPNDQVFLGPGGDTIGVDLHVAFGSIYIWLGYLHQMSLEYQTYPGVQMGGVESMNEYYVYETCQPREFYQGPVKLEGNFLHGDYTVADGPYRKTYTCSMPQLKLVSPALEAFVVTSSTPIVVTWPLVYGGGYLLCEYPPGHIATFTSPNVPQGTVVANIEPGSFNGAASLAITVTAMDGRDNSNTRTLSLTAFANEIDCKAYLDLHKNDPVAPFDGRVTSYPQHDLVVKDPVLLHSTTILRIPC